MGKLKQSKLFNQLNNMSIRMSFVLYALFSLLIGIIICIFLISMVDSYRINLNYKYENMTARYDIPENGSFTAAYSNDQTKYTIFDTRMSSPRQKNLQLFLRISGQPHSCPELLNTVFMAHASFPGSLIPKKSCVTYSISIRSPGKI